MTDQPPATAAATTSDSAAELATLLTRTADFYESLRDILGDSLEVTSRREVLAQGSCGIALEHGASIGALLELDNVASAIVLLRAQLEALVRALWFDGVATDDWIDRYFEAVKASPTKDPNLTPSVTEMLAAIANSKHAPAARMLITLKDAAWGAFNSYVHSGIQAIVHAHVDVPTHYAVQTLQTSNGLTGVAAMLMPMMTNDTKRVMAVREAQLAHLDCLLPLAR